MKAASQKKEDYLSIFNTLIEEKSEVYYHTVFRIVRSVEDAKEVVQEGFAKAYARLDQFQGNSALSSWVYRIMVNEALQRIRSKKTKKEDIMDPFLPKFVFGHHTEKIQNWRDLPLERMERVEFREFLLTTLEELPENFQMPYLLKDFDRLSEKEISEILDIPVSTVKSRLHKTRLYLRKKIELYLQS